MYYIYIFHLSHFIVLQFCFELWTIKNVFLLSRVSHLYFLVFSPQVQTWGGSLFYLASTRNAHHKEACGHPRAFLSALCSYGLTQVSWAHHIPLCLKCIFLIWDVKQKSNVFIFFMFLHSQFFFPPEVYFTIFLSILLFGFQTGFRYLNLTCLCDY